MMTIGMTIGMTMGMTMGMTIGLYIFVVSVMCGLSVLGICGLILGKDAGDPVAGLLMNVCVAGIIAGLWVIVLSSLL